MAIKTVLLGRYLRSISFCRFGAFEEFKKRNINPDGTLSAHKKFLCGLGKYLDGTFF